MNERVREILERLNPWWRAPEARVTGLKPFRRHEFSRIGERIQRFGEPRLRAVFLEGLRQVGKTTLAKQVLDELLREGLGGSQVALALAEDHRLTGTLTLQDVLEAWTPFLDPTRPALLVLDEVHRLKDDSGSGDMNWARQVKSLVERCDAGEFQVRILATGSAAGVIRDGAGILVGRQDVVHLEPLSLEEFVDLRGHPKEELQGELDAYLSVGGFPEIALTTSIPESLERIRQATRSALAADVPEVRAPDAIQQLFSILMDQSGEELNEKKLASAIGVQVDSVRRWMQKMEEVHLVHRVQRWNTSELREIRGRPKVFGTAAGIVAGFGRTADPLGDPRLVGRLVEAAVLGHLRPFAQFRHARVRCGQKKSPRGQTLGEVDFVMDRPGELLLIEVTSGTANLEDKCAFVAAECKSLASRRRDDSVRGAVVYRGSVRIDGEVSCLPLHAFLLRLSRPERLETLASLVEGDERQEQ